MTKDNKMGMNKEQMKGNETKGFGERQEVSTGVWEERFKEDTMRTYESRFEEDVMGSLEERREEEEMGSPEEWPEEYIAEFAREYNKECNRILKQEREKRGITQEKLSRGLLSRVALHELEEGRSGWSKTIGDTLMHRMGICTNYFETVTFGEELSRWRDREEICQLVPENFRRAKEMIQEYRRNYSNRNVMEEQFLLRAEAVLMLPWQSRGLKMETPQNEICPEMPKNNEFVMAVKRAVEYTVPTGWEKGLKDLWLAPSELETILLAGGALLLRGEVEEAWKLQQEVWEYPRIRQWKERVEVLIKPQAALLGIELALRKKDAEAAYEMGWEALELLRRHQSQRYLLPLLDSMGKIPLQDRKAAENLNQAARFAKTFRRIYEIYGCSEYRLWQSIDMSNTREVGMTLKMLRMFYQKSRAKAVVDREGQIVTERHLAKIEQGTHKPSTENYRRLIKQYGKYGGWGMPLLETDSMEALEMRQRISDLIGFGKYEEAEWEIKRFRRMVDTKYPRVRQELLFWEALLEEHTGADLRNCLKKMLQAFHYTVPYLKGKDMGYWVFQREELIIASNIAVSYHNLGKLDEAKMWMEKVICSLKRQNESTKIWCTGYEILIIAYDNILADMGYLDNALRVDREAMETFLRSPQIRCTAYIMYHIAWNFYESALGDSGKQKLYQPKWREAYLLSEALSEFIYDFRYKNFLNVSSRREKFYDVLT